MNPGSILKNIPAFGCIVILMTSCGDQYKLAGEVTDVDESYVYNLPYPTGSSHLLIQGYNSGFSHKGRLALDFKMKKGSSITAARDGIVTRVENSYKKGGVGKKYLHKGNLVIVRHDDGTQAYYGHIEFNGVVVKVGDTVRTGQVIATSGKTGYAALPHLHFIVWGPNRQGGRSQLPTRFKTNRGVGYLKPGKRYRAVE